jgi:hypothetical protein
MRRGSASSSVLGVAAVRGEREEEEEGLRMAAKSGRSWTEARNGKKKKDEETKKNAERTKQTRTNEQTKGERERETWGLMSREEKRTCVELSEEEEEVEEEEETDG